MVSPSPRDPSQRLEAANDLTQLFALVKDLVERRLGRSRAGIMLGLTSLGLSPSAFFGGYFVAGSNAIVLNRDVLSWVRAQHEEHHNAYAFHVLLHEYLHTLGYFEERDVRRIAHELSVETFGEDHATTWIAAAMAGRPLASAAPDFFRQLVQPPFGWAPDGPAPIEIVKGFDPDASPYIA